LAHREDVLAAHTTLGQFCAALEANEFDLPKEVSAACRRELLALSLRA
jgi:hypothetical protein